MREMSYFGVRIWGREVMNEIIIELIVDFFCLVVLQWIKVFVLVQKFWFDLYLGFVFKIYI